jgi:hypothetical protein
MVVRYSLIAILVTLSFACKDEGTPPPPYVPSITLEAVDASCTEAWLKATTTVAPAIVRLLRDNQRVFERRLSVAMKGNLVVAVGWVGSQAVAVVGHR